MFPLVLNPLSGVMKYGALIYGIKQAVSEKKSLSGIAIAGAVYGIATLLEYVGNFYENYTEHRILRDNINRTRDQLTKPMED